MGTATNRDAWVYNFSKKTLRNNINKTINYYNENCNNLQTDKSLTINKDSKLGNWTRDWQNAISKGKLFIENENEYKTTLYRPFTKINSYFDDDLNQERYQLPKIFSGKNIAISVVGTGGSKNFSVIITDLIPDLQLMSNGQIFPLYYYEEPKTTQKGLFDDPNETDYVRRDAVSDFILERAQKQYGKNVTKEDIFYYVYGFLHSQDYRETFASDLKKILPKLPLVEDVKDFWAFSKAGRQLADLHLNYESVPAYKGAIVLFNQIPKKEIEKGLGGKELEDINYQVVKMKFPSKNQKDTIIYNNQITISEIPEKAYEYVVNGKSAIEWIMERYQITTHKDSGITNNPNDWATEVGNPKYILDLLLSIINVSVQTVDIVNGLPKMKFE